MTSPLRSGQADHHLGESLAALVDGELSHDRRDRVLAHLATCPHCKAEADAQRRLKSVLAESPQPTLPQGLLARLQGLPATVDDLPPAPPPPTAPAAPAPPEAFVREADPGFGIDEPGVAARPHRGHRLAFAAAGAVSLAAFAVGGAVTSAGIGAGAASGGSGSTLSSPAGGPGAASVMAPRPPGTRADGERDEPRGSVVLPATLMAGAAGQSAPSGALAPVTAGASPEPAASEAPATRLFSTPDPILTSGADYPAQASSPAFTGPPPGVVGVVSPR